MYDHHGEMKVLVAEIRKEKGKPHPMFSVTVENDPSHPGWHHATSSGVWAATLREVKNRPNVSVSGPEVMIPTWFSYSRLFFCAIYGHVVTAMCACACVCVCALDVCLC